MAEVDLALILAIDGSASVTFDEFALMAGGCGAAFRDPEVMAGLTSGPLGASLCALVLWSGRNAQEVMVDWTRIDGQQALQSFTDAVENFPRIVPAGLTAIGEALLVCEKLFAVAPADPRRKVIDMVGDGSSNDGSSPGPIRDRLAAAGVTINGLCVLHEERDLLTSYTNEVIGGPGAFALQCPDYATFAEAMKQKVQKELALVALTSSYVRQHSRFS
jgi:Ca-activated chloride channel family protein